MIIRGSIFLLLWLFFANFVACKQQNSVRLVNDEAQVLSIQQREQLERKLVDFSNTNGTQIAVLTQNGIKEDLNQYCSNIINNWGIGQAEKNNGVLLFVDPQEHNTYLATGTGTEVWLPNTLAKQIVDNQLIPAFKQGDYNKGIVDAVDIIMNLADKAYPSTK
ncbi:hypothetical protein BH09BAC1_BH09BAC1_12260 [soil metagenome]